MTQGLVTPLLQAISGVGRDTVRGGYSRPVFSSAELELREWFVAEASLRGLDVEIDRNGIIWAWWDVPSGRRTGAIVTGSHLDSVPGGGQFDGPLGVASALAAVDLLRSRGQQPNDALAIAVFPEEEGSRYGVACLGSRMLTGAIAPVRALALKDDTGDSFAERAARNGLDPTHMGVDHERLRQIGAFIELHIEQGRGLVDLDNSVAIGTSILGHGRWKLAFEGQGNHAGTTLMSDRRDPLVAASSLISSIPRLASYFDNARATVGRLQPIPGGTNVIASRVDMWLDVRHPEDSVTAELVADISHHAQEIASKHGCSVEIVEESLSPTVTFDVRLRANVARALPHAPLLYTGAGHDAGVIAAKVPTAMLFVRNLTGISHAAEEHIEDADAEAGVAALADVLMAQLSPDSMHK